MLLKPSFIASIEHQPWECCVGIRALSSVAFLSNSPHEVLSLIVPAELIRLCVKGKQDDDSNVHMGVIALDGWTDIKLHNLLVQSAPAVLINNRKSPRHLSTCRGSHHHCFSTLQAQTFWLKDLGIWLNCYYVG